MRIWACIYIGFPDVMSADQGPQFKSTRRETLMLNVEITFHLSGVQSHNGLGVREGYHAFLRLTYRKVMLQHPQISKAHSLALSV